MFRLTNLTRSLRAKKLSLLTKRSSFGRLFSTSELKQNWIVTANNIERKASLRGIFHDSGLSSLKKNDSVDGGFIVQNITKIDSYDCCVYEV